MIARINECGHPERKHLAKGMCSSCYYREYHLDRYATDPEYVERHREYHRNRRQDPEQAERQRERQREYHRNRRQDPEYAERSREYARERGRERYATDPEYAERLREQSRNRRAQKRQAEQRAAQQGATT